MKNNSGAIRGYKISSKAWYAASKQMPKVYFGMYHEDGSTSGEICMVWHELQKDLCARLECFEDSWNTLWLFSDVIQRLSMFESQNIKEDKFVEILNEFGFKDLTI